MGALILSPSAPPRLSPQAAILVPAGWGPEGPLPPALHTLLSGGADGSPPPGAPWALSTHRAWCLLFAKLELSGWKGEDRPSPFPGSPAVTGATQSPTPSAGLFPPVPSPGST